MPDRHSAAASGSFGGASPRPRRAPTAGLVLVPLLLAVGIAPVVAQEPADRTAIEAFRDSIAGTVDSTGLARLELRLIEQAKTDRDNPLRHIQLGFLALRMGDLGSHPRYDDAASEFQWATELRPDWPYPWYGLGLAEDGVGDSQVSLVAGLQTMFGKDHLTRAANAYAKSVEVDPSFVRGLVDLASTALRQRVNLRIAVAREALRLAAATSASTNAEVLLYRGRVEREVGDIDSALVAFQSYLDRGGHRGVGLLEVARTLFLQGSLQGQGPYLEGAALDDSESVRMYRADLALIANDSVLGEFDRSTGDRRAAFLKRFWGQRDDAEMRASGERLREHYRRIFYARKNFQLVSNKRHYDIVERFRSGSVDYDDRGVIYIRHGEPTERASSPAVRQEVQPNESWRYARADGDLLFHFVAREDVQDYKLVESVFDVLGFSNALSLKGDPNDSRVAGAANELLLSREQMSPVYSRLITAGTASSQKYFAEERAIGRRSLAVGTTTDSYELSYARALQTHLEVVVAGRDSSGAPGGLLHVAYAIPGSKLQPVPSAQGNLYPVRFRLSVLDYLGHPVATVDTTRLFVSREAVALTENLVGRLAVPVSAGPLVYRVAIETGEAGILLPRDSIAGRDLSGSTFAVSDLVIGSRNANLPWLATAEDTVFFNPVGVYRSNSTMELYYEVHGLAPGTEYQTRVAVTRQGGKGFLGIFGSRKATISLAFEERAEAAITRSHRSLGLEKLSPGQYWIDLTVTTREGLRQKSRQAFEVR